MSLLLSPDDKECIKLIYSDKGIMEVLDVFHKGDGENRVGENNIWREERNNN